MTDVIEEATAIFDNARPMMWILMHEDLYDWVDNRYGFCWESALPSGELCHIVFIPDEQVIGVWARSHTHPSVVSGRGWSLEEALADYLRRRR
jgi:hypothetical protein